MLVFLVMLFRSFNYYRRIRFRPLKVDILLLGIAPLLVAVTEYHLIPGQYLFWPIWIAILLPRMALLQQPA